MTMNLPHVDRFKDRHDRWRYYFRRPGQPRVPLPDPIDGQEAFRAAYRAAEALRPTVKPRDEEGTIGRLIHDYYASSDFRKMRASSQIVVRSSLEPFGRDHGHRMVADLERKHVVGILGAMSERPGAANNLLSRLRTLMGFAIVNGYRPDDPTAKVKPYHGGEHHSWTDEELGQYEARWRQGTVERAAYALALYTGQRRGDVARMTWRDYDERAGLIHVAQKKTGAKLVIPVHPTLRTMLADWPRTALVILVSGRGAAYSPDGLGSLMATAIDAAGLPVRCVMHGLRKAAARRLAEAGCSTRQIASVTGHTSLQQVENYTRAVSQRHLATSAIGRLASQPSPTVWETDSSSDGED